AVVGHEGVHPAVIVVISPGATGGNGSFGALVDDLTGGDRSESVISVVAVERAVDPGRIHDKKIQVTVVVEIDPGAGQSVASGGGDRVGGARESAVALVGVKHGAPGQKSTEGLVGHQQVRPPVTVEIAPGERHGDLEVVARDWPGIDARQSAIAVVSVEEVHPEIDADA